MQALFILQTKVQFLKTLGKIENTFTMSTKGAHGTSLSFISQLEF